MFFTNDSIVNWRKPLLKRIHKSSSLEGNLTVAFHQHFLIHLKKYLLPLRCKSPKLIFFHKDFYFYIISFLNLHLTICASDWNIILINIALLMFSIVWYHNSCAFFFQIDILVEKVSLIKLEIIFEFLQLR